MGSSTAKLLTIFQHLPPTAHPQSEWIRAHNPADIVLWEVPLAGHCGAVNAAPQEFDTRVLGWFSSHDRRYQCLQDGDVGVMPIPIFIQWESEFLIHFAE